MSDEKDMDLNAAYRLGQEHMRRRIERRWAGWITNTIGGHHRMHTRGVANVALLIRKEMKVRDLPATPESPDV